MTVQELRDALAGLDADEPVYIDTENHCELADRVQPEGIRVEPGGPIVSAVVIVGNDVNVAWL